MKQRRWWSGSAAMIAVALVAACGGNGGNSVGEDVEGAGLVEPFGELAAGLYQQAGADRGQDNFDGIAVEECPVLTGDDTVAVAEALGVDDPDQAEVFGDWILGPPETELLSCTIDVGDEQQPIAVELGPWSGEASDKFTDLIEDGSVEATEGDAGGLDPDAVAGVTTANAFVATAWVEDGFHVALSAPFEGDAVGAFDALAVAVAAVDASLGSSQAEAD
jgi:hypothetical protein